MALPVIHMSTLKTLLVLSALLFAVSAPICAQGARYLIPERIERATEAGEDGKLQWDEWPAPDCGSCKGTG